jgi:vacuolar-type H+-ATPase subunit D/Vma8
MAQFVIYQSRLKAEQRREQLTDDARQANFLMADEDYREIYYHPTKDLAAIEVVFEPSISMRGIPTQKYDFSIFFTAQELARAVTEFPRDWVPERSSDEVF